jgi:hypothetical protein
VSVKELFLCHHSVAASQVYQMATELRLRGIVPWVDKQRGGFKVGDSSPEEARRVILEDCFGLLLYATPGVLRRWFIREIEIPAAKEAKQRDPTYVLTAFARGVGFSTLSKQSKAQLGVDLGEFHGISSRRNLTDRARRPDWIRMAVEVLRKWLSLQPGRPGISLQFSTRQLFPDNDDDLLRIDATEFLVSDPLSMDKWDAVRQGLLDVQSEITHRFGRPRIYVHGSKHLTAAFLFGRVFARNPLDIRQTPTAVWSSDTPPTPVEPFTAALCVPEGHDRSLFVEIASGHKNIAEGVDDVICGSVGTHPARLSLRPADGPLAVDNALCVAMTRQAYLEIERAMAATGAGSIHLFVAAPQAFLMMLAQCFAGMPEAHLYEWDSERYIKSCVVPAGPAGAA